MKNKGKSKVYVCFIGDKAQIKDLCQGQWIKGGYAISAVLKHTKGDAHIA